VDECLHEETTVQCIVGSLGFSLLLLPGRDILISLDQVYLRTRLAPLGFLIKVLIPDPFLPVFENLPLCQIVVPLFHFLDGGILLAGRGKPDMKVVSFDFQVLGQISNFDSSIHIELLAFIVCPCNWRALFRRRPY